MSEYIKDLRKIVGHKTLIQCGACVIIVNNAGEILLGRRADNHLWGYFGGSVEIDEKVEDCAKRELLEETGLIADELSFFAVISGEEVHYTYPNGDEVSNIEIVYLCNHFHGEIKLQKEEFEELKFFKPSEIDIEMISPPLRPTIQKYLETYKYSDFIQICNLLNKQLSIYPLLYGSLGLEKRLSIDLNADDIDVLLPEKYIKTEWGKLLSLMNNAGYRLVDEHEHEFYNGSVTVAYASLENLTLFADIEISDIPLVEDKGAKYLLLELPDYLKVYEASSKDGYRKNVKNKQDNIKIALIKKTLEDKE